MHLDSHDRVDIISQIATQLKLLSETCKVTVLVTNQVTSKMNAPNKPKNQLTTEHLQGDYGTNSQTITNHRAPLPASFRVLLTLFFPLYVLLFG